MRQRMTEEQERHLEDVKRTFESWCDEKYRMGQAEHGGDLWKVDDLDLVDSAIEEAIDMFVYLVTLRQNIIRREER